MYKKIVLVDFDGVLHSYTSGWQGDTVISDPPVPGAIKWLMELAGFPESVSAMHDNEFSVCIYSTRSRRRAGRQAMKNWLIQHGLDPRWLEIIEFPAKKPPAHLTIDDRAICFEGVFPSVETIRNFKPWNRRSV